MALNLEEYIASISDFPSKGILFRDVTPLIQNGKAFKKAIRCLEEYARKVKAEVIVGPESRGFIFGCPLAVKMGIGFVPVRKPGKLPRETVSKSYTLEYGNNEVFMHKDAIKKGQRVLLVDDLLATGGTAKATCEMIEELGGIVAGCAFVIELYGGGLAGKEALKDYNVFSIMHLSDR